ncbi:MAG TPA: zinc ribbon domain-containing protein [Candidatus Binataceae bacterium]|nr:zinc ribbon domain-containing protein [Candidatus Binataceae bacterium]
MAPNKHAAQLPSCPRCGAAALFPNARFCGHCGASLADDPANLPRWQRPAPAKFSHVVMNRKALSCPECGYPISFGFKHVCRQCGAHLVMVPRLLHPNHVRVYVAGPRAALADLAVEGSAWLIVLAVAGLIGAALK